MQTAQQTPIAPPEMDLALDRATQELNTSYLDLCERVERLTQELHQSRTQLMRELAEKEVIFQRLSAVVQALPGGILLVDRHDIVRDANPQAIELVGEPVIGELWTVIEQRAVNLRYESAEGDKRRHVAVSVQPLAGSGEKLILITDTTAQHETQALESQKQRLMAMGEMAARLAHQIRTPIASTTLYLAQLAREDLAAAERGDICDSLSTALRHVEGTIDSMLGFIRGDTRELLPLFLQDVMQEFEALIRDGLSLNAEQLVVTPVDRSVRILGAREDLVGALSNLVCNAVQASGEAPEIHVSVNALDARSIQIRVRDHGPGIDEAHLPHIFDPFYTTRAAGTGLGLAVVAMTVNQHGGDISARNHPTGGAEFLISLPMLAPGE
jgi:two-component system sensor histidine kinase FlrB